ncbi:MAG: hypothetical protein GKR94_06060 [Gammaproteobacteria bacterium]|nr:hypothetical protein [Gammaproteobacteria bacterium]
MYISSFLRLTDWAAKAVCFAALSVGLTGTATYWMKPAGKETALRELNIPPHAGACCYYKKAGFDVAYSLCPPQAN